MVNNLYPHGKIRRNSIGALGNQMYVTDDTILIDIIRSKQTMNPIRKNQKFVITDKRIMMGLDDNNTLAMVAVVVRNG